MSLDGGGFIDLRLNRQDRQNQDGFWPSFTDIMTVIVMIFMIAMVVLLLRNMELVKQLRATMEAERSAMELARTTGEEKESLALKLIATENELSMLRIKLMRLEEERTKQASTIGSQDQEISQLLAAKQELTLRRDQLVAENYTLSEKLKRAETDINNLQQDLATVKQDLTIVKQNYEASQEQLLSSQRELAETQADLSSLETQRSALELQLSSLRARYAEQSTELQTTKAASRLSDNELATLRADFANLKVKYDELVRPARTPEGRFVVEVRYGKSNGEYVIEYQTSEEPGYSKLSREVLEQKLTKLKREKKNGLYVKVIFPEESGLSFNEAWSFTAKLHERFDYYFQKSDRSLIPAPQPEQ